MRARPHTHTPANWSGFFSFFVIIIIIIIIITIIIIIIIINNTNNNNSCLQGFAFFSITVLESLRVDFCFSEAPPAGLLTHWFSFLRLFLLPLRSWSHQRSCLLERWSTRARTRAAKAYVYARANTYKRMQRWQKLFKPSRIKFKQDRMSLLEG